MTKKKKVEVREPSTAAAGIYSRAVNFIERNPGPILLSILLLALLLRIVALFDFKDSLYFDHLLADEKLYHDWAVKIAEGRFDSTAVYEFAPLPAYVMALVYKLFSADVLYIRYLNILLGTFTCFWIYLIGKEIGDRAAGLTAGLAAAVYKPFILYSIVPLKTALSLFLFALTVYFFLSTFRSKPLTRTLLLGISAGLLVNVRPNSLVLLPLFAAGVAIFLYRERLSVKFISTLMAIYMLGLSLALTPFLIRNYRVAGELALTTSQAGFNLYLGNNPDNPTPYYQPVTFASSPPSVQGIHFTIEASRRVGKKLSPSQASNFWIREVFRIAGEQPGHLAQKLFLKIRGLFHRHEHGDHYHIGFLGHFVPFFRFPFLGLGLVFPLGMAGLVLGLLKSKKMLALAAVYTVYALTLVFFFLSSRYRLPLMIILIPCAVAGIKDMNVFIRHRQNKNIALYLSTLLIFFMVEFLPVPGSDDLAPHYNVYAGMLMAEGKDAQARYYCDKSSRQNSAFSAFGFYCRAVQRFKKGEISQGLRLLENIPDAHFAAASKYELIGDVMANQRNVVEAVRAYGKALSINSGLRNIHVKLSHMLWHIDRQRALEELEKFRALSLYYNVL